MTMTFGVNSKKSTKHRINVSCCIPGPMSCCWRNCPNHFTSLGFRFGFLTKQMMIFAYLKALLQGLSKITESIQQNTWNVVGF